MQGQSTAPQMTYPTPWTLRGVQDSWGDTHYHVRDANGQRIPQMHFDEKRRQVAERIVDAVNFADRLSDETKRGIAYALDVLEPTTDQKLGLRMVAR